MNFIKMISCLLALVFAVVTSGCIPARVATYGSTVTIAHLEVLHQRDKEHYESFLAARKERFYTESAKARAAALLAMDEEDVLSAAAILDLDSRLASKESEFLQNLEQARVKLNNRLQYYRELISVQFAVQDSARVIGEATAKAFEDISTAAVKAIEAEAKAKIERDAYAKYLEEYNKLQLEKEQEEFLNEITEGSDDPIADVDVESPVS